MENRQKAGGLIEGVTTCTTAVTCWRRLRRGAAELFEPYSRFMLVAADFYLEGRRYRNAAAAYQSVLGAHPDHDQAQIGLKKARERAEREVRRNADPSNLAPIRGADEAGAFAKKVLSRK